MVRLTIDDEERSNKVSNTTSAIITTPAGTTNPLQELRKFGQSAWLDYIRRSLITSGELKRLVDEDGLGGVTSNPAIFEKAITGSTDYADALVELQKRKDLDAMGIYERHRDQGHSGRGRYAAAGVRPHQDARRLREPGSFAVSGARHAGDHRRTRGGCGRP